MTQSAAEYRYRLKPRFCAAGIGAIILLTGNCTVYAQTAEANSTYGLTEIVVTAQRREQTVQDVPVSMQVLTGAELEERGATGFEDYLNSISSVGFTYAGNGAVQIGIRGVSNVDGTDYGIGTSKSAVGVYLNDVPVQGAGPLPDLTLYDLSRVEVLKGPQGTLYGEDAMGGAIKMIMNPADPSAFAGKTDVGVSNTAHGGTNYDVRGAVNIPLIEDRVALRIAATYRDDSGFIDNIVTGQNGVGGNSSDSVRALLDAKLTDRFTSEVVLLNQHLELHGFPQESVGAGDLQSDIPDQQYNKQDFDLFALTLKYHFDVADITSSTAYARNDRGFYIRDPFVSLEDGGALLDFGLEGIPESAPQGYTLQVNQTAVTEELRVASVGDQRLTWTAGAYFRTAEQDAVSYDTLPDFATYNAGMTAAAANPGSAFNSVLSSLGASLGEALFASATDVYQNVVDEKSKQYALFGESDFKLTPNLSLKTGLRWFTEANNIYQFNRALAIEALDFALYGYPATAQSYAAVDDHGLAPRVGLSYSFSKDILAYALASKGFRSGGPNFTNGQPSIPIAYKSDSLWNYELGVKSAWLDHRLVVNGALYYIDWRDIQVPAVDPNSGQSYVANAGTARITGGELQINALPTRNLLLGLNLGLLDSKLTSLGPTVSGATVGSELPDSPKATGSAFLQYSRPIGGFGTGVARFDYQYVGREAVKLIGTAAPEDSYYKDAYTTGRAQIGIENHNWNTYLYVDNLWDERGVTDKQFYLPQFPEQTLALIRPRTVGLRVGANF